MREPSHFVNGIFANALKRRLCVENKFTFITATVLNIDARCQNPFQSYLEKAIYFLKLFASSEGIAKLNAAMLHYVQPSEMIIK